MTDRHGIFAGDDPFEIARRWLAEAESTELNDPNAMALATVDDKGMPNVRIVLLKIIETDSFVFYTNYTSAKGRELELSGKASFVLHWKTLRRQVRVRGLVSREDGNQADAYYASRALESKIGAWASKQSHPISSREELEDAVENASAEHMDDPKRPPFWGGFRIRPTEFEFWADGPHRLHDRFKWSRISSEESWIVERLAP